jgi:7,8-dihydropterin-6-yl-methyl-4-(beta-D-ribofuranosyl)aminobenzene 5'-phosphate synthase
MIAVRPAYEATGGKFVEVPGWQELFPGAWLTGPIIRKYPEKNWNELDKVMTPAGLVEDTIREDLSLVLNTTRGLVVITGCGHAGIINIFFLRLRTSLALSMSSALWGGFISIAGPTLNWIGRPTR